MLPLNNPVSVDGPTREDVSITHPTSAASIADPTPTPVCLELDGTVPTPPPAPPPAVPPLKNSQPYSSPYGQQYSKPRKSQTRNAGPAYDYTPGAHNEVEYANKSDTVTEHLKHACFNYCAQSVCVMALFLVVPILQIYYGALHLDNKSCDTLDNGIGIAQWMLGMGCLLALLVVVTVCLAYFGCNHDHPTRYCFYILPLLLVHFGFLIYGAVVVFSDHPNDTKCPGEIHMFGFVLVIIQLIVPVCLPFCFCCAIFGFISQITTN